MTQSERNWKNFEILVDNLGESQLLQELMQALSSKEQQETLEHIANMWDIEIEEDEG